MRMMTKLLFYFGDDVLGFDKKKEKNGYSLNHLLGMFLLCFLRLSTRHFRTFE